MAPAFAGGRNSPFEEEADDEDIWNSLCQPAAITQVNHKLADGKRAFEVSHQLCKTHARVLLCDADGVPCAAATVSKVHLAEYPVACAMRTVHRMCCVLMTFSGRVDRTQMTCA